MVKEKIWNLWLKLSNENEIEDYEINTWNYLQIGGFLKELQWVEDNENKYSFDELSKKFSDYINNM